MFPGIFSSIFSMRGGFGSRSSIDDLLDKGDVQLDALLAENDLVTELRFNNQRLIQFFKREHVRQLIK